MRLGRAGLGQARTGRVGLSCFPLPGPSPSCRTFGPKGLTLQFPGITTRGQPDSSGACDWLHAVKQGIILKDSGLFYVRDWQVASRKLGNQPVSHVILCPCAILSSWPFLPGARANAAWVAVQARGT